MLLSLSVFDYYLNVMFHDKVTYDFVAKCYNTIIIQFIILPYWSWRRPLSKIIQVPRLSTFFRFLNIILKLHSENWMLHLIQGIKNAFFYIFIHLFVYTYMYNDDITVLLFQKALQSCSIQSTDWVFFHNYGSFRNQRL